MVVKIKKQNTKKKWVIKRKIKFENYKNCLRNKIKIESLKKFINNSKETIDPFKNTWKT